MVWSLPLPMTWMHAPFHGVDWHEIDSGAMVELSGAHKHIRGGSRTVTVDDDDAMKELSWGREGLCHPRLPGSTIGEADTWL